MRFRSLFTRSSASALTVLLALCILAGMWGCRKSGEADEALATVNGKKILRSEVDKYYKNQTANSPAQPEPEQADSLKGAAEALAREEPEKQLERGVGLRELELEARRVLA